MSLVLDIGDNEIEEEVNKQFEISDEKLNGSTADINRKEAKDADDLFGSDEDDSG